MLLNDFYTIMKYDAGPEKVTASISIDKNHKIFDGHFPGLPVVPGVCMLQIIKEIMEVTQKKKLMLNEADSVKFLSVINPLENHEIDIAISFTENEKNDYSINASLFSGAVIFFKLKANLTTA